jgi:hypothetical protein
MDRGGENDVWDKASRNRSLLLLTGCRPSGPTEADMTGWAVRGGGPPISSREVADCAVDRAEIKRERE